MDTSRASEIAAITRIDEEAEWPASQHRTSVLELMFCQAKIQNFEGERLGGYLGFQMIAKAKEECLFVIIQRSKNAGYIGFLADLPVDSGQDSLDSRADAGPKLAQQKRERIPAKQGAGGYQSCTNSPLVRTHSLREASQFVHI